MDAATGVFLLYPSAFFFATKGFATGGEFGTRQA